MSVTPLGRQIAEQLAGARCEQDLDYELANLPEGHWRLFVEYMGSLIRETEEKEPGRAGAMRCLLDSYKARWHDRKNSGFTGT